jgi:hypothetical protein
MFRVLLTEALIFVGCLALFPTVLLVVFSQAETLSGALRILAKGFFSPNMGHGPMKVAALWVKVITPYLVVQAWRAHGWSRSGGAGKKWANLYFSVLGAAASVWFFLRIWEMLAFMHALGDLPSEVAAFLQMEGVNTALCALSAALSVYCFAVFLRAVGAPKNGEKGRTPP